MDEMMQLLRCPSCESRPHLELRGGHLACPECSREYPVLEGIPNLVPEGESGETATGAAELRPEESPEITNLALDEVRVLVIHGPNLNLLGIREPSVYGSESLADINAMLREEASRIGCRVSIIQSNHEGDIVEAVQSVREEYSALVINPAGFTHTSVAIRDALAALDRPKVEVHLTNIHAREEFRRVSLTCGEADGMVSGFGAYSYVLGLQAAVKLAGGRS